MQQQGLPRRVDLAEPLRLAERSARAGEAVFLPAPFELGQALIPVARQEGHPAQRPLGLGVIGLQGARAGERIAGSLQVACIEMGTTQIHVGLCQVGGQVDCTLAQANGLGGLTCVAQQARQVDQGGQLFAVQGQAAPIALLGCVVLAQGFLSLGQAAPAGRILGESGQGRLIVAQCRFVQAGHTQGMCA